MGINTHAVQSIIDTKSLATVLTYYENVRGLENSGVSSLIKMAIQDFTSILVLGGLVKDIPSNEVDEIYTNFILSQRR